MRREAALLCSCALLALAGCSRHKHTARTPAAPAPGWSEIGIASWYGNPYHGRPTSSGEIYDMEQMTAAHRTLPFGAIVRVTNLTNNKKIEVRINDRGPFAAGRIVDISRAAARNINMIGPGTARVRLELLSYAGTPTTSATYTVQVGRFFSEHEGARLRKNLMKKYQSVDLIERPATPGSYLLRVGRTSTQDEAQVIADEISKDVGIGYVVRLELRTHQ
ncbi:septal ring lytic transglycosylase RlpA family protein [Paludibaculum fermentans]|uniref:Probable endolytic peptidoglycan transglycosylase RlpA n=1 Tax=Paludibaculum fermentans TaxID=1473598 RepID=A0A7S7NMX7_PALFE|nr:septal ring lytic transglycosylase RlpA family protein [Paludibaculum fermentans]QOY86099.1 septal ring lytic transglycosylase RlpA family protein [Paludibaculum fermentans]